MAEQKTPEQLEREAYNKRAKVGGYFDPDHMPGFRPDLDPGPQPKEEEPAPAAAPVTPAKPHLVESAKDAQ